MNMSNRFKRSKVQVFVISALTVLMSNISFANEKLPELPAITIQVDKEGAKTKTNVVTVEKQNQSTATDLRALLSDEPSINFGSGNGRQWWTIRGMAQDQISMVVDGSSTDAQIFHHEGRFSLDPSLIKIVKVQKGTGSASAGIGINNGAVVAKTVDAQDLLKDGKNFGAKINAGYANNKEYSYGASAFARAGQFDFLVAGNWIEQSNYKAGKKEGSRHQVSNSALDKQGVLAKIGVDVNENHRFVLGHRQEMNKGVQNLRNEFDFVQSYLIVATEAEATRVNKDYKLGEATGSRDRSGRETYYVVDSKGNYVMNEAGNNPRYREIETKQTTLEWQAKNLGFITRADADISYATQTRQENAGATGTKTWVANLNLDSQLTDNSLLKYGVNYRKQHGHPSTGIIAQKKDDIGVYVESINKIGNVTLTGGLRYDAWNFKTINGSSRSDYDLNPSLGVVWDVTPTLSLNASHNYATRSPRFVETLLTGNDNTGTNHIRIGKNTVADRTRSTEVGFNYDDTRLNVDGSYFWTYTDNLAAIVGRREIGNNGTLKNTGYELNAGYTWQGLKLHTGVAHNKPTLKGGATVDNVTVAMPIGRTWTAGVSYRFDTPNIELGYKGRLVEDSAYTPASGNRVKREGYHLHDIYANWKPFNNDDFNINFAIYNIADKYYKSHSQRAMNNNALPSAGRDIRVGFNYTF